MLAPVPPAPQVLENWRQALEMVRADNPRLRTARARVLQAEGQARQALAPALPSVTATGNLNHHLLRGEGTVFTPTGRETGRIPDPATSLTGALALRVPLFAPREWHDHGTAKRSIRLSRLEQADLDRQILGSAADAIVRVVSSERLSEISRVSLRTALETRELHRRRAALGAATAFDVLRAEQEVTASRAQIVSADETLRQAREALGAELGRAEPLGVTPNIELDALAKDALALCKTESKLEDRADVRARQMAVDIAKRNVKSVDYDHAPTLDGTSQATYYAYDTQSPNREHLTWTIGAVLTWTLYDGGLRYGTRTANRGRLIEAETTLDDTRRRASIEVSQAQRSVSVAEANLRVSRETRDLAKESDRLARLAFANGSLTSFDVVDAARRLREAELDLTLKEFEVVRARILAVLALASCQL
jgi:outer membrane protein TolC